MTVRRTSASGGGKFWMVDRSAESTVTPTRPPFKTASVGRPGAPAGAGPPSADRPFEFVDGFRDRLRIPAIDDPYARVPPVLKPLVPNGGKAQRVQPRPKDHTERSRLAEATGMTMVYGSAARQVFDSVRLLPKYREAVPRPAGETRLSGRVPNLVRTPEGRRFLKQVGLSAPDTNILDPDAPPRTDVARVEVDRSAPVRRLQERSRLARRVVKPTRLDFEQPTRTWGTVDRRMLSASARLAAGLTLLQLPTAGANAVDAWQNGGGAPGLIRERSGRTALTQSAGSALAVYAGVKAVQDRGFRRMFTSGAWMRPGIVNTGLALGLATVANEFGYFDLNGDKEGRRTLAAGLGGAAATAAATRATVRGLKLLRSPTPTTSALLARSGATASAFTLARQTATTGQLVRALITPRGKLGVVGAAAGAYAVANELGLLKPFDNGDERSTRTKLSDAVQKTPVLGWIF